MVTDKGTIHAEHVVNAGGLWAREVGAMAGVYLPLHPMEHQYLVTEEVPLIREMMAEGREHPHVMDPAGESYLRQEGMGLCIGFYEQTCRPWAVGRHAHGTSVRSCWHDDFDKIEDSIAFAYRRFPDLARAGVKNVIHGPFTFAPDGNPLVGPVPGLRNYWSACGVMAGFSQGGGVGLTLAQWMIEGEPERDVFAMDVARFGKWISPGYTLPKVIENYQKRFSVSYPNEELPAARPHHTTPMYDIFSGMGAVWGQQFGLEVANYFAQGDEPTYETPSFRRSDAFERDGPRGACRARGRRHQRGAELRQIPRDRPRRARLARPDHGGTCARSRGGSRSRPMLSPKGRLIGDFTISCLCGGSFQLTASYGAQDYHSRWFAQNMDEGVIVENISDRRTGFQIAGPKAREVLQACTQADVSAMKFLDVAPMTRGHDQLPGPARQLHRRSGI